MTRLLHPRYWGYHLVVVVALVAAGLLGLWQYHGWQERRTAEARDLTQVAPIPLADAIGPDDPFPGEYVGQPVEVVGTWVPGSTVYVSGREHEGREGYWVVDAVRVGVVAAARRARVVAVTGRRTGAGGRRQPGRLAPAVRGCRRPTTTRADDVLPQLRVADLAQRFDEDLYGAYVVAREPGDGLVAADLQQLPEAGRFTAIRNLLYALEWWFFGAFALFVWWRWATGDRRARDFRHSVGSLAVSRLFIAYRVLAMIVGVLLAFCALVALPLKYLAPEGSDLQQFGESASIMWVRARLGVHDLCRGHLPAGATGPVERPVHRARPRGRPHPADHLLGGAPRRGTGARRAPRAGGVAVTTAFVLGGGGVLGAAEVGMLQALFERDIRPDLVLGTSIGALNGALVARDPTLAVIERLTDLWQTVASSREVFGDRPLRTVRRAVSTGTHVYSSSPMRRRLAEEFGDMTFEDLPVRFQVCAANIERAAEHWFTSGPIVPAIVASAAVPGLLPPAKVGDEHFLDGGIVNSIPLGRAVALGADVVYVLQVGRIDRPLQVPKRPWEVARVSFEIARRHRFARELAEVPDGVVAHVLPARGTSDKDDSILGHRDFTSVTTRIEETYRASLEYLDQNVADQ